MVFEPNGKVVYSDNGNNVVMEAVRDSYYNSDGVLTIQNYCE
jgi:hypothetical protein